MEAKHEAPLDCSGHAMADAHTPQPTPTLQRKGASLHLSCLPTHRTAAFFASVMAAR